MTPESARLTPIGSRRLRRLFVVALVVVGILFTFGNPARTWFDQRQEIAAARQRGAVLDEQNQQLQARAGRLGTDDEVERIARERRPKLLLAGWSAYPRFLDFERLRAIADDVGALLMVDMAHFAGLVAGGRHPNPVPYADVVTTTVHKTLGGARGGMIICREEYAKKINSAVFPGQQGGPLEHVIAGKAVAFRIAASELFRERQERTVAGAQAVAAELLDCGNGVNVLTGGTDVHLVLVDLRDSELDGIQAEDRLHDIGITVNRNAVPFDPRPPAVSSGLRVGTSALATRGLQAEDFSEIGSIIARALQSGFDQVRGDLAERVTAIADRYPLYAQLGTPTAV